MLLWKNRWSKEKKKLIEKICIFSLLVFETSENKRRRLSGEQSARDLPYYLSLPWEILHKSGQAWEGDAWKGKSGGLPVRVAGRGRLTGNSSTSTIREREALNCFLKNLLGPSWRGWGAIWEWSMGVCAYMFKVVWHATSVMQSTMPGWEQALGTCLSLATLSLLAPLPACLHQVESILLQKCPHHYTKI